MSQRKGQAPAVSADIGVYPVADLLSWIHARRRAGVLLFQRGELEKRLFLEKGQVIFASSNQGVDRIGHSLVRAGRITLDQLRDAEQHHQPPHRFGKSLVERGCVTPRQLWDGLALQVEEIARSLFSYPTGQMRFWDGPYLPDNVARFQLQTDLLVRDGRRWRRQLGRLVAALGEPRIRIERSGHGPAYAVGAESQLLTALEGESAFLPLCRRARLDPPTAARALQLLHRSGAVRIRRNGDDPELTQRVRAKLGC